MDKKDYPTTIPVMHSTKNKLKKLGKKGETYDSLLNYILDHIQWKLLYTIIGKKEK